LVLTTETNFVEKALTPLITNINFKFFRVTAAIAVAAAAAFAQDVETKTISGIECVLVKAGTFMMGSPTSESGRDSDELQHQVTITKDYWVSKYPVTQGQYKAAMGTNPSYSGYGIGDNYPVNAVDWYNADAFCKAVGGRLLTEAEWEFAARGGNKSKGYIYSGSNNLNEVGWYWDNIPSQSSGSTGYGMQPVGTKAPNELGIYDMSGNVLEWCSDLYGDYPSGAVTDPTYPSSDFFHVNRGGSWNNGSLSCRVAYRNNSPSLRYSSLGLRVAFDAAATPIIGNAATRTKFAISFAGIKNGEINLNLKAGNYTAELYNLQGRLVSSVNISALNGLNSTGIRTDNLSKGMFILNVKQAGASVLKQKLKI